MTENPYIAPKSPPEAIVAESRLRQQARYSFHVSAIVLFLPAIYNYWAFDQRVVSPLPDDLAFFCRTLNLVGFVIVSGLIWKLGLPTLEAVARLLRAVFANRTDRVAWEEVLHQSVIRLIVPAVLCAALWFIWVYCVYQTQSDFHVTSWVVGVLVHALAACWYLPLFNRWYRLAVSRSAIPSP
jgi:hypothetical protein